VPTTAVKVAASWQQEQTLGKGMGIKVRRHLHGMEGKGKERIKGWEKKIKKARKARQHVKTKKGEHAA